mgnify:FL=1
MKNKRIIIIIVCITVGFLTVPVFHLLRTYFKEDSVIRFTPEGYTDDASGLNLTKVHSIIQVPSHKDDIVLQLRNILEYAEKNNKRISIAGAKHSMGGHTIYPDGILLNMRPYSSMSLDTVNNILTIGSGALWSDALQYLNKYDRSVSVMQAFSSFSIGGSISVNGHGWQHNAPPVSSTIVSFSIMKADGQILECDRLNNEELFGLAIGGYGLFGIILDIKLRVVDNRNLKFKSYKFRSDEYIDHFEEYVDNDPSVQLVFGRLNISNKKFLQEATLNIFRSSVEDVNHQGRITENERSVQLKRLVFRSTVNSEYGKRLRWNLENNLRELSSKLTFTRNQVLNDNVSIVKNNDSTSTDILHEYFIPRRNLDQYIEGLKQILPNEKIDLLNITIRNVYPDTDSFLRYADEEMFAFVMLFNQRNDPEHEMEMRALSNSLARLTHSLDGTYYLPYRLHVDKTLFKKMYPQSDEFFRLKLKYDPEEIFQNRFYLYYR